MCLEQGMQGLVPLQTPDPGQYPGYSVVRNPPPLLWSGHSRNVDTPLAWQSEGVDAGQCNYLRLLMPLAHTGTQVKSCPGRGFSRRY